MNNLYTLKESKRYPGLFVRKYTKKVFWDNLWHKDPTLIESRGHVFNKTGDCVVTPFTKIFNRGENGTDIPRDHNCLAVEKINGFMASVTYVPDVDDVVISTTGSLDSDFVDIARKHIPEHFINELRIEAPKLIARENKNYTYMFEIVDVNDPHIIPETEGAYLIGVRVVGDNQPYYSTPHYEKYLDVIADEFGMLRPMWYVAQFSSVVETAKVKRTEGFVVYDQDERGKSLKIKTPYYLSMKAMARCKDIFSLDKRRVDEEFYGVLDHIRNNMNSLWWAGLTEQDKLDFLRDFYRG